MTSQGPDPDAYTAPFMLTKAMHRDVYPAIDPHNNPDIKADGKVIVVTGATGGIGAAIAKSFLDAGAKGVVIVGRTLEKLQAVADELDAEGSKVLPLAANVLSQIEADGVFKETLERFGRVDVLVNASGTMKIGPLGTLPTSDWWENFEANVHGPLNLCHSFINATEAKGTIINLVSLAASFLSAGMSGYGASKLALVRLGECLDLEHAGLRVFSVHPGIVEPDERGRGAVFEPMVPFMKDKAALAGGLAVYLAAAGGRADFLSGGYVHANWDVEELEEHKDEIVAKGLVKLAFLNGRLQPGGYPWSSSS